MYIKHIYVFAFCIHDNLMTMGEVYTMNIGNPCVSAYYVEWEIPPSQV